MFLLIAEFSHLFGTLMNTGNPVITAMSDFLFHHADWEGLHFWDLIQPFFCSLWEYQFLFLMPID